MSGSRPTAALLVVLSLLATASAPLALAAPRAARGGPAPSVAICRTVLTITQAPPSPTAQTTATVKVEYGEVITTNPTCMSVGGGELFTFTVNGVDRTSYFTYGYNATTGLNEAYGTNVPLVFGVTNSLVAETQGGTPAMPDGSMGTVADTAQVLVTASIAVTPDNMAADIRPLRQNTQRFTLVNGPTAVSYNLTATCTGTATGCTPSAFSVSLAAGASAIIDVTYQAAAPGTTGIVKLLATWPANAVKDSGWVTVTVQSVGSPVVNVESVNPGTSVERDLCLTIAMGSGAASECGDLRLTYALPTTRTKNKARTPTLLYNSQHAHPYPLIAANVTIPSTIAAPDSVTATVFFGQALKASGTWAGTDFVTGGTRRIVLGFDALTNPTGRYPYTLEVKSWYDTDLPYTQTVASTLVIVNRSALGSGAGWWIAGVESLYFPDTSQILWVGGDGSTRLYRRDTSSVVNGATRCNWAAAALDRPDTLSSNCAGVYTRHAPHGVKVEFDGSGKHVRTINRLGDATIFTWHPTLQRVESIAIPPSTANLTYSFYYNATSGLLDSIVAPPADTQRRVIRVSTDLGMVFNQGWGNMAGSRITALRGPDTSQVRFTYVSTSYRAQTRTDRRGTVRTFTYDAGQRITRTNLAMGVGNPDIVTMFQPQETQGLIGSGRPAAADTALVSSFMYGPRSPQVGDTTRFWLNRWGAPTRIRNALGYETVLSRESAPWPTLVTKIRYPNGREVSTWYGSRALPDSTIDWSHYRDGAGSRTYATTRYTWDQRWDFVTSITLPEGEITRFSYDTITGNRVYQEDGRGLPSRVTFDYVGTGPSAGLLRATQLPDVPGSGTVRDSVSYDALGNLAGMRSPRGVWTRQENDAAGRTKVIRRQIFVDSTRYQGDSLTYNVMGDVTQSVTYGDTTNGVEAQSLIVNNYYNAEGHLDRLERTSVPSSPTDVSTLVTSWRYDRAGRVREEIAPDGKVDSTWYDPAGNVDSVRPRANRVSAVISMQYDALNRLTKKRLPPAVYPSRRDGIAQRQEFSSDENPPYPRYSNTPGGGYAISADSAIFAYDAMGNVLAADNADARVRRSYFANGMLKGDTLYIRTLRPMADGTTWSRHVYGLEYAYDLNGRLTDLTHPRQLAPAFSAWINATRYTYDAQTGQLGKVTPALGGGFTHHYNGRGELDTLFLPGSRQERFTRDLDGNLIRHYGSLPGGVWRDATFTYDGRGKILSSANASYPGDAADFRYSGLGHLVRQFAVTNATTFVPGPNDFVGAEYTSDETFALDAFGNIGPKTSYHTKSVYGQPTKSTWNWGLANTYEWATGRLKTAPSSVMTDTMFYDGAGNLEFTRGDRKVKGSQADRASYFAADGLLRVVDYRVLPDAGAGMLGSGKWSWVYDEYRYDALGRRVLTWSRRLCAEVEGFARDVSECNMDYVRRTVWDGNRELWEIQMPADSTTPVATVENDVQPVLQKPDQYTTFDPNPFFGRVLYTYGTAVDRPLAITRVYYADDPGTGWKLWDPMTIVPLWNYRGQVDQFFFSKSDGTASDYNCLSTQPRRCAEMNFPAAFQAAYGPEVRDQVPLAWQGTLGMGKRDEVGLNYRRARYYDAKTGRFTQEDPIGLAGGMNLYGFANGDPVNFSDPFGLCPPEDSNFGPGCPGYFTSLLALAGGAIGSSIGGGAGGAGGLAACSPGGPVAIACGGAGAVGGAALGGLKGAATGAAVGGLLDGVVMFAKKGDIKQVDQAIRKALGRKPTDDERGDFRDQIHQEKQGGKDLRFDELVRLAKELFKTDK